MKLELEPNEIQYLVSLAGQVPMGQTLQAGMAHLIPKILQQTNASDPAPMTPAPAPGLSTAA